MLVAQYGDMEKAIAVGSKSDIQRTIRIAFETFKEEGDDVDHDKDREQRARPHGAAPGRTYATSARVVQRLGIKALKLGKRKEDFFARELASMPSRLDLPYIGPKRVNNTEDLDDLPLSAVLGHPLFFLDLCSGSKSWTRWNNSHSAVKDNVVVITVDNESSRNPDWLEDINEWRKWLPQRLREMKREWKCFKGFDHVHFSPPEYCADGGKSGDKVIHLVQSGLALIKDLSPNSWTIDYCRGDEERHLATQPCMQALSQLRIGGDDVETPSINYCACHASMYGCSFKPQDWWTNIPDRYLLKLKSLRCEGRCWFTFFHGPEEAKRRGDEGDGGDEGLPDVIVESVVLSIAMWIRKGAVQPGSEKVKNAAADDNKTDALAAVLAEMGASQPSKKKKRSPALASHPSIPPMNSVDDQMHLVEDVLKVRTTGNGVKEALVKWSGLAEKDATWEVYGPEIAQLWNTRERERKRKAS